jgi:hypothetical protein
VDCIAQYEAIGCSVRLRLGGLLAVQTKLGRDFFHRLQHEGNVLLPQVDAQPLSGTFYLLPSTFFALT